MDLSFSFPLPCMLMILTIINGQDCADIIRISGNVGGNISIPLEIHKESYITVFKEADCTFSRNVSMDDCEDPMCLRNGNLEMINLSEDDEGTYKITAGNDSKIFLLKVCELPPVVHIHCLADGRANLSCDIDNKSNRSVYWTLNERRLNDSNACQKDAGKRIILEKGVHGKLVCHRSNTCNSSSIEVLCNHGDLLQHPLFLYIVAACGAGALLLAIIASLITCSCMKSKHHFTPVPAEEEKDEGLTLSAISSEGPKSPPNGDHCEATEVLIDSSPNTGLQTSESFKPEPKMDPNIAMGPEVESEPKTEEMAETEFQEVDSAALETVDDCFPDPIDA
ncbi:uncharacterized protein LOC123029307 [Varanus komodoensis]|uniref:uncharacterized protein LOC123029307 n=1 Tax=Varanus komodoensis TaxID=61221 RepID=UPI001CF7697E|nr:uncharacterized protein LOC123029307 [Varanus komodoensis]